MRSSNTQLPTADELHEILAGESQRKAVRYDFLVNHPALFATYKGLGNQVGFSISWIDDYAQLELETLGLAALEATEKLYNFISFGSATQEQLDGLFDALVIDDRPQACDAIFVFGSPANARIAHAVGLYQRSLAPIIITSGKGPHYGATELSEAERTAQFAIEQGVPEGSIMIEPESITLPDNVKRTLDMFELQQFKPQKICVVATSYIMQRAVMEWYKFTPWEIEIIGSAAPAQSPELRKDSWYRSERGIRMLLNEYVKIVLEHKMDLIRREQ